MRRIEEIQEPYKLEILDDISERHPDAPITIYHVGEPGSKNHWWDLCAGPHVESTGDLNPAAVELESVAGEQGFQYKIQRIDLPYSQGHKKGCNLLNAPAVVKRVASSSLCHIKA